MVRGGAFDAPDQGGVVKGGVKGGSIEAKKEKKKSHSATILSSKVRLYINEKVVTCTIFKCMFPIRAHHLQQVHGKT